MGFRVSFRPFLLSSPFPQLLPFASIAGSGVDPGGHGYNSINASCILFDVMCVNSPTPYDLALIITSLYPK